MSEDQRCRSGWLLAREVTRLGLFVSMVAAGMLAIELSRHLR